MLNTILFILLGIYVVWSMFKFSSLSNDIQKLEDEKVIYIDILNKHKEYIKEIRDEIYSDEVELIQYIPLLHDGKIKKKTKLKKEIELIHDYLKVEKKEEPAKESKTLLVKKK